MACRGTDVKTLRLGATQGDRCAVDPKLERIAAEGAAQESDFRPFDEAEHHQALHRGISGLDRIDADSIARL
jgi:hypothetical protein